MRVAQVLDVFGEVAEKEYVVFADFACDFDLVLSVTLNRKGAKDLRWHHRKYR